MSKRLQKQFFAINDGGLKEDTNLIAVDPRFASSLENIDLSHEKEIRKGGGSVDHADLGSATSYKSTGILQARFLSGTDVIVFTAGKAAGGKFLKDDHDGTLDDVSGAVAPTSADLHSFEMFFNASGAEILIATNYNDLPRKWTGAGNFATLQDNGGNTDQKFKYLKRFQEYLFAGYVNDNGTEHPNYLYYSNIRDGENGLDGTQVISFDRALTGLAVYQDRLWIFEKSRMWSISGYTTDDFSRRDIDDSNVGCLSHHSIVIAEGHMFWYGPGGFYGLTAGGLHNISSDFIRDTFATIAFDKEHLIVGMANVLKHEIHWFVPVGATATYPNTRFIYNYRTGAWSVGTGWDIGACAVVRDATSGDDTYYIGNGSGDDQTWKYDTGVNIDGAAMTSNYKTHALHLGDPNRRKRFRYVTVFCKAVGAYTLDAYANVGDASIDLETDGTLNQLDLTPDSDTWEGGNWGELKWNAGEEMIPLRFAINKIGRFLQLKFGNNNLGENFRIFGFEIAYQWLDKAVQGGRGEHT